jgi:integrase
VKSNIILPFRKRYLRQYKDDFEDPQRKLLSIEETARFVNSIMDPRDKAMVVLLAKTGIREVS